MSQKTTELLAIVIFGFTYLLISGRRLKIFLSLSPRSTDENIWGGWKAMRSRPPPGTEGTCKPPVRVAWDVCHRQSKPAA